MAALTPQDDVSVVVYDLDGVITRKDSFTAFLGSACAETRWAW